MSQHDEDRDKVVNALGGKKGLIDSGLPSVVFLVVFNFAGDLNWAMWSAISLSLSLAIFRLVKKDTIQHAFSGVIGVAICVIFASRSGNAEDFYIPKLLTNLGYGTVYLIANLAGWPILGLVLGPLLGENFTWRNHPARKKMYIKASWLWVGMFFLRIAVQYPIYLSGNVNLLGTVNLAMGYPLFFATAYGTWLIIKAGPPAQKVIG
jgi:xanthine/uracil permease